MIAIAPCLFAHMLDSFSARFLATPREVLESLELHQMAQTFRLEVEHRDHFDAYCAWYYRVAAENQQDLETMRSELNVRAWFDRPSV